MSDYYPLPDNISGCKLKESDDFFDEAYMKKYLGKPDLEKIDGLYKLIAYKKYNVQVIFNQGRGFYITVRNDFDNNP